MREQLSSSRSFDPDKPEIRTKLSSLKKSGIIDPRHCLCEYRPWSHDYVIVNVAAGAKFKIISLDIWQQE
jgi:hypothetical protein